jgi:hypothetical protein
VLAVGSGRPSLNAWAAVAEMQLPEVRAKNHARARGNEIEFSSRLLAGVLLLTGPAFPFPDAGMAILVLGLGVAAEESIDCRAAPAFTIADPYIGGRDLAGTAPTPESRLADTEHFAQAGRPYNGRPAAGGAAGPAIGSFGSRSRRGLCGHVCQVACKPDWT